MKNIKLPQRILGKHIKASAIGYGAMGLSEFYGPTDDISSLKLLHQVVDKGISLIDTADMYGRGHNEQLIGSLLGKLSPAKRHQLTIATKCGIDRSATSGYARSINNSPDYIRNSCEASLSRLGIERIDLYYIHRLCPDTPVEQTMEVLSSLVAEGKIARVGLCEVSASTLRRAHACFPVDVVQTEYSLWTRDIEDELLPELKRLGIGLVPYSPLGRGFLTGKYLSGKDFSCNDFRRSNPRFSDINIKENEKLLHILKPMSLKYGCTMGQVALAWLLSQWDHIIPIPGTKRESYLQENLDSCFIKLEMDDIQTLNNLKHAFPIHGERYTPEGMKGIF